MRSWHSHHLASRKGNKFGITFSEYAPPTSDMQTLNGPNLWNCVTPGMCRWSRSPRPQGSGKILKLIYLLIIYNKFRCARSRVGHCVLADQFFHRALRGCARGPAGEIYTVAAWKKTIQAIQLQNYSCKFMFERRWVCAVLHEVAWRQIGLARFACAAFWFGSVISPFVSNRTWKTREGWESIALPFLTLETCGQYHYPLWWQFTRRWASITFFSNLYPNLKNYFSNWCTSFTHVEVFQTCKGTCCPHVQLDSRYSSSKSFLLNYSCYINDCCVMLIILPAMKHVVGLSPGQS